MQPALEELLVSCRSIASLPDCSNMNVQLALYVLSNLLAEEEAQLLYVLT